MTEDAPKPHNHQLLSFVGALGAILIFGLILWLAYLPNRADPIDTPRNEERRQNAAEAIAAGQGKLSGYTVIDADAGVVQIPIEEAMVRAVRERQN